MNIELARFNMIEQQIRPWEVLDQTVLSLLAAVRREDFVPAGLPRAGLRRHRRCRCSTASPAAPACSSPRSRRGCCRNCRCSATRRCWRSAPARASWPRCWRTARSRCSRSNAGPPWCRWRATTCAAPASSTSRCVEMPAAERRARPAGRGAVRRHPAVGLGGRGAARAAGAAQGRRPAGWPSSATSRSCAPGCSPASARPPGPTSTCSTPWRRACRASREPLALQVLSRRCTRRCRCRSLSRCQGPSRPRNAQVVASRSCARRGRRLYNLRAPHITPCPVEGLLHASEAFPPVDGSPGRRPGSRVARWPPGAEPAGAVRSGTRLRRHLPGRQGAGRLGAVPRRAERGAEPARRRR